MLTQYRSFIVIHLLTISFMWSQTITVTHQVQLHGGAQYLTDNSSGESEVKFHAITVGQVLVGHASSANYSMDFGIWAFYLKEPDAPYVDASDGDPTVNGIDITFMVDPLSPPLTLTDPPANIGNDELGGYTTNSQVTDNVVAVTKTSDGNTSTTLVNTIDDYAMKPGGAYPWQQDVRPGIMYSFGVTGFNRFGLSPEGVDVGFTLSNGRVEGTVTVPGSNPGTSGNGVKDVAVKLHRADGETIGSSIYLDGVDDYLYADNIYDELILNDQLYMGIPNNQTSMGDLSVEFWFKNSSNEIKEYLIDMSPMLSIYQEGNSIYAEIGENTPLGGIETQLTNSMSDWHHISLTKGNRGACLRNEEYYDDNNLNDQWDGDEPFHDYNGNSFFDEAGTVNGIINEEDCISQNMCYHFTDANNNGEWDPGEVFSDDDGDGQCNNGEEFNWSPSEFAEGIMLYLDGNLVTEDILDYSLVSGEIINVGRKIDGTNYFNGYIDDLRIWDHARTQDEVLKNKGRFLSGQEDGLLGYWKMDAGMLNKAYNLIKYEEEVGITNYIMQVGNNFTLSGASSGDESSWWSNSSPNQYISSFTDINGNYAIKNIAYDATGWDGTQFSITPYKDNHDFFDPPGRTAYIRLDYYEHHNMNFTDNSLFGVTGKIHYKGEAYENCTIDSAEVQIKYLGDLEFHSTEPPTYTENGGIFRLDVEPERTFVIQAVYKDHSFQQTYSYYNITNDKVNNFEDTETIKTLNGSVTAGICENQPDIDLGPYTVTYTEKNDCVTGSIGQTTAAFSISGLPPLEYDVKVIPDNFEAVLTQDILVANLDDYNQDSVLPGQVGSELIFKHYPPLRVDINRVDERTFDDNGGDTTYLPLTANCNDGTYIFDQGKHYSSYFNVKEAYSYVPQNDCNQIEEEVTCTNDSTCEWSDNSCRGIIRYEGSCIMTSFNLNVIDNITNSSMTDDMLLEPGPTGEVEYFFTARTPNIVGELISDGIEGVPDNAIQSGFKQYIRFDGLDSNESIGRPKAEGKLFAYINGIIADPDQINVNTSTTEIPFFVLRDPPGDASYSYLSEEQQVCQTMSISNSTGEEGSATGTISTGADFSANVGVSVFGATFSTNLKVDITADVGYGFSYSNNSTSSEESENCFTVSSTYSTSDDESFIGGDGDIFVGSGLSMTFSKAIDQQTVVDVSGTSGDCIVSQGATYTYGVDGLASTYMHSQSFIENSLIPQLEAQAPLDTLYQHQADYWKELIALNEDAKAEAVPSNYDLLGADPGGDTGATIIDWSAGTIYEFSKASEKTFSSSHDFEYTEADELSSTFGVEVNGLGFEMGASAAFTSGSGQGQSGSLANASTNGFVFSDNDPGDHFLVEIKEDPIWGMPVYNLIGGQSECPWEVPTSKRYDPILQAAGPDLAFGDIADISEVGELNAAQLKFNIANNSPTLEAKDYMFRLRNESNPLGALVTLNGQPMTSPFQLHVPAPVQDYACQYSSDCEMGVLTPCGTCDDDLQVTCSVDSINELPVDQNLCDQQDQSLYTWHSMYMPGVTEATVYVRKDDASSEYNYDGLIFEQYVGCAEGDEEQTYSTTANISFEKPCTNITLVAPSFGEGVDWEINGVMKCSDGTTCTVDNECIELLGADATCVGVDILNINVYGYELVDPLTNNIENLDEIYIQYADIGTEDWILVEGASVSIDALSSYDAPAYYNFAIDHSIFQEEIGGSGYKLRAVTFCSENNKNYSNALNGSIDTAPPIHFQLEPADNVLSGGDEISISYGEALDCNFIDHADFEAQNMTMSNPFSTLNPPLVPTCIDDKIVLNINGSVAPYTLENDTITITVTGLRDLLGNINSEVVTWSFLYNQNPISWSEPKIMKDIYIGDDDMTITTILQNIGGGSSAFGFGIINGIPDGVSIDPMEGWLNSQGQTEINIALNPYMEIGPYTETIYAENSKGHEPLELELNILCRPPEWDYNYTDYQYSMQIIAELAVEGAVSSDVYDRVVATIDGEVRGIAQVEQFITDSTGIDITYRTYLTIHGNSLDHGKEVGFRIWDNDSCTELWNVTLNEPLMTTYSNNQILGNFGTPKILNATDLSTAQHIDLNAGWSWISLNLGSQDMSLENALSYLDPNQNSYIGSQSQYSQYSDASASWEGTLTQLNNKSMYHIFMDQQDALTFIGLPPSNGLWPLGDDADIDYVVGWNWVAYTPQLVLGVDEALIGLQATQYDIIKNKFGLFSEYVTGIGWLGSLTYLHPGEGYMLNTDISGSFTYPGDDPGDQLVRSSSIQNEMLNKTLDLYAGVNLNPYEYQYSMSIISDMSPSTSFLSEHNLEDLNIIAYVDDEARGITKLQTFAEIDKDLLFLSVHGNKLGERVYVRVYDVVTDEAFLTSLEFDFEENEIIGSVDNPVTLSNIIPVIPENYELSQNYPNPFNPTTRIDFQIPEDGQLDISIYNIRGQQVATLQSGYMQAGYGSLIWNGTDRSGVMLSTGIYFVKMEAVNYQMTRKMMFLK